ncbi:hypothetical protein ACFSHQ_18035 [Gemmobacter lanyuensis]
MTTQIRSIGELIAVRRAAANTAATAGGSGDNTEVVGVILDRAALGFPQSAVVAIPYTATLAAGRPWPSPGISMRATIPACQMLTC